MVTTSVGTTKPGRFRPLLAPSCSFSFLRLAPAVTVCLPRNHVAWVLAVSVSKLMPSPVVALMRVGFSEVS